MTFLRNSLLTLFSNLGMTLVGLLTGVLLARTLGPAGRGLMTTVSIWPAMLAWVAGLSLGFANIHFGASEPETRRRLFANSFWAALVLGGVTGILAVGILPHFVRLTHVQHTLLVISLLFLPVGLFSDYAVSLLYGTSRFGSLSVARIISPSLTGVLLVILWLTHSLTVTSAILASWVGGWCSALATVIFLWREGYVALRPDPKLLRRCFMYSSRIHLGTLASLANGRLDQLLMTLLVAPKALGLYAFAVTFSEILRQATGAISTVLFPRVSAETEGMAQRAIASQAARWTLLIGTLIAVALGLSAQAFVSLLWGPRFSSSVTTIYVLLPGTVLLGLANTMTVSLNGAGKPGTGTWAEAASLAIMVPLLWFLLPRMGIFGAGLASTCGYATNCLVSAWFFRQTFGDGSLRELRPSRREWDEVCTVIKRLRVRLHPAGAL